MLGTQNLLLFVATGTLLNLTPGQDTFYILGRSVAQGRRGRRDLRAWKLAISR